MLSICHLSMFRPSSLYKNYATIQKNCVIHAIFVILYIVSDFMNYRFYTGIQAILIFVGMRWIYIRIIVPGMVTHDIIIVKQFTMIDYSTCTVSTLRLILSSSGVSTVGPSGACAPLTLYTYL